MRGEEESEKERRDWKRNVLNSKPNYNRETENLLTAKYVWQLRHVAIYFLLSHIMEIWLHYGNMVTFGLSK